MIDFPLYKISYGHHEVLVEDPAILKELVMQILKGSDRVVIKKERR